MNLPIQIIRFAGAVLLTVGQLAVAQERPARPAVGKPVLAILKFDFGSGKVQPRYTPVFHLE